MKQLLKGFLITLWRVINNTRKLILNVLVFGLLFALLTMGGEEEIIIEDSTALILNIRGNVVEQKQYVSPIDQMLSDSLGQQQQPPEVLLSDIVKVIKAAAKDNKILTLVLDLQSTGSLSLTKAQEITTALEYFKAQGKEVIAYGANYSQDQYYLASHADKVWLDPDGYFMIEGYGRYQLYFKSALEKLGIKQHIFRVGTFKSAVEPFMLDNMSEEAKKANEAWLGDLWADYKEGVATARNFETSNFDESADVFASKLKAANGSFAEYALNNQWVDELKTREQMVNAMIERVGENKKGTYYKNIGFDSYLKSITKPYDVENPLADKIAVIVAKGTILDGTQKPGTIGGVSTAALLRKARQDENVKAVVLRVDSPGGSKYASELIQREVDLLRAEGKPVVASMGTYAASGGYWISAAANKIYAAPTTITGSIGIFGMFMTFEDTLATVGVYADGVGTTEFAGFGPYRPLPEGIGNVIQQNIERGYQDFLSLVAENREMTLEDVDAIAQGRVWSGKQAHALGLVDELGSINDAIEAAAQLAGVEQYDTKLIEQELSPTDKFLQDMFGQAFVYLAGEQTVANTSDIDFMLNALMQQANELKQLNDPQGAYTICLTCKIN
ncbi:signal peptide peptidase SppA [Thalassotalea agarivorans]|uniref:Signal peptide peptidase A. Serine peptidase. MEROPS family S49 n=1 Tax=Thalassotalea agarivorans TaxID=349064 RepID=A0A1I0EXL3_THASX|nr:signal peptide peptidase SppA [Thalassotalea agarivorans]SET50260.1 signal peptide peptidase A. Serine peptidase. MEROPS family S49 [Thalassotalea agarivorans]